MPIVLYVDVHIPQAITSGLRRFEIDMLMAQKDGAATFKRVRTLAVPG